MSKITKAILEFMDKEIQRSKLIYEADEAGATDEVQDPTKKSYEELFGVDLPGSDEPLSKVSELESPVIPTRYSLIAKDRGCLATVDHALLKTSLDMHYFSMNYQTGQNEPKPLLIWGAPGIGKSAAVKEAAKQAARQVAQQKINKGEVKQFIELKPEDIEAEFSKSPEEIKDNFYFIEWNKISKGDIQNSIILGPATPSKKPGSEEIELVHRYDLRVPAKNLFIFFDVRVAGMSEQDILGMPFRADVKIEKSKSVKGEDGKSYTLDIPHINLDRLPILKLCCEEKDLHAFIMWDEINQGNDYVQAALYSIILDRQIGNATLAPGIGNFAAANSEMWAGGPLKPALANRFSSCYLWLSPEEWLATHDKELMPGLKNFIKGNLSVSFYITDEGWEKEYVPILRGSGSEAGSMDSATGMEEYIKQASKGRWPSPRDLTKLNSAIRGLLVDPKYRTMPKKEIVARMKLLAQEMVGDVFANHFYKYMHSYVSIKWEMLVNPKYRDYAIRTAKDMNTQEAVRDAIYDHFYQTYELAKSPHKTKFKSEARDIMAVFCNVGAEQLDFAMTPISRLRDERLAIEGGQTTKDKVNQTILEIFNVGKSGLPPNMQQEANDVIMRIKQALLKKMPGQEEQKYVSSPTLQPPTTPAPAAAAPAPASTTSPVASGEEVEEKYFRFNKIFEEISGSLNKPQPETVVEEPSDFEKTRDGIRSILEKAAKALEASSRKPGEDIKEVETRNIDTVNQIILQDNIMPKEQKQKLIARVKNPDSAINIMLMLRAFLTGAFTLK